MPWYEILGYFIITITAIGAVILAEYANKHNWKGW